MSVDPIAIGKDLVGAGRRLQRGDPLANFWVAFKQRAKDRYPIPWDAIDGVWNQPEFQGGVIALLEGRRTRARETMTAFLEGRLEDPPENDVTKADVIDAILTVADESAAAAMPQDRDVTKREGALTREAIAEVDTRLEKQIDRIVGTAGQSTLRLDDDQMAEIREAVSQPSVSVHVHINVFNVSPVQDPDDRHGSIDDRVVRALTRLETEDPVGAALLRQQLQAGSHEAVAALVVRNSPELDDGSGKRLVTAARILEAHGEFDLAELAFIRSSRAPDAPLDKVIRRRLSAAGQAFIRGDTTRGAELIDEAKALQGDHPAVRLALARQEENAQAMLDLLADVETDRPGELALLEITRGQAFLALEHESEAEAALGRAIAADSEHLIVREFAAVLPLVREQRKLARREPTDAATLRGAGEQLLTLHVELRDRQRSLESGLIAAHAIEAFALAGDFDRAQSVLDGTSEDERQGETIFALARAAMHAQRPDFVVGLIPADVADSLLQVIRADALTFTSDAVVRSEAAELLRGYLEDSDDEIRSTAALALISTAAVEEAVPWSDRAEEIVRERDPLAAAVFKAELAIRLGRAEGADTELLRYATQPLALRVLIRVAVADKDWSKARSRAEQLVRRSDRPDDRLLRAEVVRAGGESERAQTEFLSLARDTSADDKTRGLAYRNALQEVSRVSDFSAVRDLSAEWLALATDEPEAHWSYLFGLARLGHHVDALAEYRAKELVPESIQQARLAAELYIHAASGVDAAVAVDELSARFGREDEGLEGFFIYAATRKGTQEPLPPETAEHLGETLATFRDRFPDQQALIQIKAPETPEEFQAFIKEHVAPEELIDARTELLKQVGDGQLGVFNLAAAGSRPILEIWARMPFRPLGYGEPALDDLERSDAADALGGAAVWDPASIFTVQGLGDHVAEAIRGGLPGSVIAQATLDDAIAHAAEHPEGKDEHQEIIVDASGAPTLLSWSPEQLAKEREESGGRLRLAQELIVQPSRLDGSDSPADVVQNAEDYPDFAVPFAATLSVALRSDAPIYSDDRFIRSFARQHGLKAFGTVALLDAMADRGLLTGGERDAARRSLNALGAWGVVTTSEELIGMARASSWNVTAELAGALRDQAAWKGQPLETWLTLTELLAAAHDEAPETLPVWTWRVLDVAEDAAPPPAVPVSQGSVLLAMSFDIDSLPPRNTDAFIHALIRAIRDRPRELRRGRHEGDVVIEAFLLLLSVAERYGQQTQQVIFNRGIRRIPSLDLLRVIQKFIR